MMKSAAAELESRPPRVSLVREQAWLVQAAVAHISGVALKDLCATTRRRPRAACARQIAMYLCHVVFAMSLTDVAAVFGRDRSTVAHAIHRIEERREDPDVERLLGWLEAMLRRAWRNA